MNWLKRLYNSSRKEVKDSGKLYPEHYWEVSIDGLILTSIDWNKIRVIFDLSEIERVYVRTTNSGPTSVDVWYGIQTVDKIIEIPQGCKGEQTLIDYFETFEGFLMKDMTSVEDKIHECWKRNTVANTT